MKATLLFGAALLATTAHAGTIYLCKAYNGSMFWASDHCNRHNALIDRIESVADGIPWDQQVQQAEHGKAARSHFVQASTIDARQVKCAQLTAERDKIESRYTNWQWQPPEVINPDQKRMRGLRAELAANQCRTQ